MSIEVEARPARPSVTDARRPLRSRQTRWAGATAGWLARRHVAPNWISFASLAFATVAGGCLALAAVTDGTARAALLIGSAAGIQLRLLCNLLDGMVAVEGGLKTPSGEIFNDLPDRVSDALILLGAGYFTGASLAWGSTLGWAAALLAIMTAYVRVLGATVTGVHHYFGPMAKPHRMALMTAACLVAAVARPMVADGWVMAGALSLVVAGCLITIARRTRRILNDPESAR